MKNKSTTYLQKEDIKDTEADDMIHMGSDHRCVMAIFTISMLGKNSNHKDIKGKHDTVKRERCTQTAKASVLKCPSSKNIKKSSKQ